MELIECQERCSAPFFPVPAIVRHEHAGDLCCVCVRVWVCLQDTKCLHDCEQVAAPLQDLLLMAWCALAECSELDRVWSSASFSQTDKTETELEWKQAKVPSTVKQAASLLTMHKRKKSRQNIPKRSASDLYYAVLIHMCCGQKVYFSSTTLRVWRR